MIFSIHESVIKQLSFIEYLNELNKIFQTSPPQDIDKPTLARYAVMGTFIYSIYMHFFVQVLQI